MLRHAGLMMGLAGLITAASAQAAASCPARAPFGLAARPLPRGDKAAEVLPARVGRFVRESVARNAVIPTDEDFNVTYRAGRDTIFVGLSRPGRSSDLAAAVRTSRDDAVADKRIDRRGETYCISAAPFYYKIPDFLAWTRGSTFFYADASSPAVLDEFMAAFPY